VEYREYKPDHRLAQYVECYWSAFSEKPPFQDRERLIPDGTIELMFNFGDNYAQITNDTKSEIKGSHIIGLRKKSLIISQTARQDFFSIRFRLGGTYPFFKIPVHLFTDGFFSLKELLGKAVEELESRLYHETDNHTRVEIANRYLLGRLQPDEDYQFVERSMPALLRTPNIRAIAAEFNCGYKMMERKFNRVLGLAPAELLKVSRFNKAILQMYSCRLSSLTDVAHAVGYYDQSHFIRDFRQITGLSPKDFLKSQFTIVQVIQPALAQRMSNLYNL
jgi:AraC-like DNA-binding protein